MKILYDNQIFWMQRCGGISNSFVHLIEHLPGDTSYKIASTTGCGNVHLEESRLPDKRGNWNEESALQGKCWKWIYDGRFTLGHKNHSPAGEYIPSSVQALKEGGFDVFHPTFFDSYFLRHIGKKPFVLTVHDMTPELGYVNDPWQVNKKKMLVEKASHIVAVSNYTKTCLMELLHVPEEKITVVYHGAPSLDPSGINPLPGIPYLFFVGKREGYKFFLPMMHQLVPVLKAVPELRVVCAGPSFTENENHFFSEHRILHQMIQVHPSDSELMDYYANAVAFLFPSVCEGFGIPILEAYKAGCPVMLNRASCFPEIAGDAALYFHLGNAKSDLASQVIRLMNISNEEKEQVLFKQKTRLKRFSWGESAGILAKVYENCQL